jgi:hypothetical protein
MPMWGGFHDLLHSRLRLLVRHEVHAPSRSSCAEVECRPVCQARTFSHRWVTVSQSQQSARWRPGFATVDGHLFSFCFLLGLVGEMNSQSQHSLTVAVKVFTWVDTLTRVLFPCGKPRSSYMTSICLMLVGECWRCYRCASAGKTLMRDALTLRIASGSG